MAPQSKPRIYLIDGYNFVFRAFHSLPPLSRPDGTPIGAVYGFVNMLFKFIQDHGQTDGKENQDLFLVVLDSGHKNKRHHLYPEYKANRPTPPDELIIQFPIVREAVAAFDLHAIEAPNGYEADDVIASYAQATAKLGYEVIIVSSDKDLMQLVTEKVNMYDPMRDLRIGPAQVTDKLGVTPEQVADYLALVGDSSDNVPGVAGIGAKTAAELLKQYGSLESIYTSIESMPANRRRQLLQEQREQAYLSLELVKLYTLDSLPIPIPELERKSIHSEKLLHFLEIQGFKSLLSKISQKINVTKPQPQVALQPITLLNQCNLKPFFDVGTCAIHITETTASLANAEFGVSIPITTQHNTDLFAENTRPTLSQLWQHLKPLLESHAVRIVLLSAKPVYKQLASLGIALNAYDDLQVMAYALSAGQHDGDLQTLIKFYLAEQDVPEETESALTIIQLYQALRNKLVETKCVTIYEKIDKPLVAVLADMELRGVHVDVAYLKTLSDEFEHKQQHLQNEIYQLCGQEFNIGSPKQLAEILFEHLKLPILGGKSKSGQHNTDAEVLEKLVEQGFEVAAKILEWRQFAKLLSTYTKALPQAINPTTGRVHTTFSLTLTSTARLSSYNPNLQNIPIRTEEGNRIRGAFNASTGNIIISADYSQIELRLLAHMANISTLQDAFHNGQDIHTATASQLFEVPLEHVTPELRRSAKTINFGIIYGISAFGLSRRLGIEIHKAQAYIDAYFRKYPGIKEYMSAAIEYARTHGFVKTLWGRNCYIEGINDKNPSRRGFAERAAINAPLQGTASDIIRKSMVNLPKEVLQYLVLQIHDELLFEVPAAQVQTVGEQVKKVMESVISLNVPLQVSIKTGKSWMEAH